MGCICMMSMLLSAPSPTSPIFNIDEFECYVEENSIIHYSDTNGVPVSLVKGLDRKLNGHIRSEIFGYLIDQPPCFA